jgi:glycosyltransferase involved in cell wall biosynthesis
VKKITFIVWARYHRRSELLARHLGASIHFICHGKRGRLSQVFVRYLVQTWQTWQTLCREKPDIIFIQNPPIFAVLIIAVYAKFHDVQYAIDSHTAAFISLRWNWSAGLHRWLSSRAQVTIVHNTSQEKIVDRWGCRYCVLDDPVEDFVDVEHFSFDGQFNVVVVSSFDADEPLDIVFDAAAGLANITFYVTGDYSRIAPTLLKKKPDNCLLTGYISNRQYAGLLQGADVIIDLVSNGETLLCGAFEAVSAGTPLIVSDWPVLRECFPMGTVYVPNTVEGVRAGVHQALREQVQLHQEILLLREQHQVEWMRKFAVLKRLLQKN